MVSHTEGRRTETADEVIASTIQYIFGNKKEGGNVKVKLLNVLKG